MTQEEKILCAAIWYKEIQLKRVIDGLLPKNCDVGIVVTGHRHAHAMWTMTSLTGLRSVESEVGKYVQGFLTNLNRFVDRKEAAIIATNAKQINTVTETLFSEDLY